jgi:DNA repair protein RadA/Sms
VNLVGGLRLDDPALDLGLAAAIISSLEDAPVKEKLVVIGELGLSGEVRAVSYADRRVAEARKLGFTEVVLPKRNYAGLKVEGVKLHPIERLTELPGLTLT